MNFSKKLVMCVAFLCVASFAQQLPPQKSTTQSLPGSANVRTVDSQNNLKKTAGVKPQTSTWTKIKDMFQ